MAEVTDAIQQHDSPVSTQAESAETASHAEAETRQPASQPETQDASGSDREGGEHPLDPGGKRFNQVWARAKDAEVKLQTERERAARLEGELDALRKMGADKPVPPPIKEYTWQELQRGIDAGQITLQQALEHREEIIRRHAEKQADDKIKATLETTQRQSTVQQELAQYRTLVPEAVQMGTKERVALEREFTYLVNMGYDSRDPRTELLAARNVLGDMESIKQRKAAATITSERTIMKDTHTTNGTTKPAEKDPIKGLTADQTKHYQRMIDRGIYKKGWDDVREELKWERPR